MDRKSERGQTLVFVALMIVVLLGFAGLAVDMGYLRYERRLQQTAADSAAIAGATDLAKGGVKTAAQSAAQTNGFTHTSDSVSDCNDSAAVNTICVEVNNPPSSGPHTLANDANGGKYVEVLVSKVHSTFFMRVLGRDRGTVTARAVATNVSGGSDSGCLYTLGPPSASIEGVNLGGSSILDASSCGIIDNGNFNTNGNKLTVKAGTFGVSGTGNQSGNAGGSVSCSGAGACPAYGMPAAADPLVDLAKPTKPAPSSSCPTRGACDVNTSGKQTLEPGTYHSIDFGKNSTVTLDAGTYYIDGGGITFEGSATVTGSEVMFYFTDGATVNKAVGGGNQDTGNINLSAPTSGTYEGILFYQDPADTAGPWFGGNDTSNFNGLLYFPSAEITFQGNSSSITSGIVIAKAFTLNGNPTVTVKGAAGMPPGTNPILKAVLVE